jgi:hypothetical protein
MDRLVINRLVEDLRFLAALEITREVNRFGVSVIARYFLERREVYVKEEA